MRPRMKANLRPKLGQRMKPNPGPTLGRMKERNQSLKKIPMAKHLWIPKRVTLNRL